MWLVVMTIMPLGKCLVRKDLSLSHPTASQQQCTLGAIRVRGINTDVFKAGFIDICDNNGNRTPLCGEGFDVNAARVICTRLGFPIPGTISSHVIMM